MRDALRMGARVENRSPARRQDRRAIVHAQAKNVPAIAMMRAVVTATSKLAPRWYGLWFACSLAGGAYASRSAARRGCRFSSIEMGENDGYRRHEGVPKHQFVDGPDPSQRVVLAEQKTIPFNQIHATVPGPLARPPSLQRLMDRPIIAREHRRSGYPPKEGGRAAKTPQSREGPARSQVVVLSQLCAPVAPHRS